MRIPLFTMTLTRSNEDWSMLLNEYSICKKKLESKREGLKILMQELEQTQIERDIQKNKVTQLQSELGGLKEVLSGCWQRNENGNFKLDLGGDEKKIKTLSNLLQFSRDENRCLQNDLGNLKQLYTESQRDNQLLRASLSKYEAQKKVGVHEKQNKEKLIVQLEDANATIGMLEQELQIRKDERKELDEEVTVFRQKNMRLNTELNYILHNDDRRIVDVDTLVLENQYLKEVIKQYKEEKSIAIGTAARYKEALRQRQTSTKSRLSYLDLTSPTRSGHHEGFFSKSFDQNTVSDLQRVNKALTERLSEKDLALKHQRNTNRILGTRVSVLEKKLKTLEISGLWSHVKELSLNFYSQAAKQNPHEYIVESSKILKSSQFYSEQRLPRLHDDDFAEHVTTPIERYVSTNIVSNNVYSIEHGPTITNGARISEGLLVNTNDEVQQGTSNSEKILSTPVVPTNLEKELGSEIFVNSEPVSERPAHYVSTMNTGQSLLKELSTEILAAQHPDGIITEVTTNSKQPNLEGVSNELSAKKHEHCEQVN